VRAGLDAATLALYVSGAYDVHARLRVANGDGTMVNLQGRWMGIRFEFPNPDQPIPSLTVDLLREYAAHESGADSLAPMVQTSTWNRLDDGVTYSPLIELGRTVTCDVALTAVRGARPADGSALWYEVFRGFVTKRPAPKKLGRVLTMHCAQAAGKLEIAKSEAAYTYAAGTAIETAIVAILTNNGFAAVDWPVDVPVATGKVLSKTYAPGLQKTTWEQAWATAQSIGMLLLPTYRADGTVALSLFEPPRTKTVADMTVPKIHDFEEFDVDGRYLGNVGRAHFTDSAGVRQQAGPVEDADSIARYGDMRRPFWLSFAEDSPVRSYTDAVTILGLAVADVADPEVLATVATPAMPFIECARDLYAYAEDARFFTGTQNYAPFSAWFEIRADQPHRGAHGVSGKPSAGYRTWRSKIATSGVEDDPANRNLYDVFLVEGGDGSAEMTFKRGPAVALVMGATGTYPTPRQQEHKAALQASGVLEPLTADSIYLAAPAAGEYTLARVVGYDSLMVQGEELFGWVQERFTTPDEMAVVEQAAADALLAAAGAQAAADGKINTYFSDTEPVAEGIGDLWFDEDAGNLLYRWDGTDWIEIQDQAIIDALLAAADAQETADGKIVSFYQSTPPTAEGIGDMWTDTDDGDQLYRWNGSAWVSISPKKLGMHIGSVTPDALGVARVTANAEPDVAIGLPGAQYQVDGGPWIDLTVSAERTVAFNVTQTAALQIVNVRGLRVLGDTGTAGPPETGDVPAYIPPPVLLTAATLLSVDEVGSDHVYAGKVTGSGMLGKNLRLRWYEDNVLIETDDPVVATDHNEMLVNHTETGAADSLAHTHRLEVDLYDADTDFGTKVSRDATTVL
jgi:hypothetical protein